MLEGQVPVTEPCVLDDDCTAGAFCDRGAGCPGQCRALRASGGACNRNDQCQDGLQCLSGQCGLPAQHNEACGGGVATECYLGLFCIGEDKEAGQAGQCKSKSDLLVAGTNQVCNPVQGVWCQEGLACVVEITGSGSSTAFQTVCKDRVASGADCNTSLLPQQCPAGQYCPADLDPEYQAECVARPGAGQACGAFNLCAPDHYCDSGKRCRPIRRLQGATCKLAGECLSGVCAMDDDGVGSHCIAEARCRLDDEPEPVCGDEICEGGETCESCETDCGVCQVPECGDQLCNGSETCESCAVDCGACPVHQCGDNVCNDTETCESCEADCGYCPAEPVCGDDSCNGAETCSSCAADCGACPTPYSGPCNTGGQCAPSQVCDTASVPGLFGLPPNSLFGVWTQTCSSASTCPGPSNQRACGDDDRCYLRCDIFEGVFNPARLCPFGMECIEGGCTWRR